MQGTYYTNGTYEVCISGDGYTTGQTMMTLLLSKVSYLTAFPASDIAATFSALDLPTPTGGKIFDFAKSTDSSTPAVTTATVRSAGFTAAETTTYINTLSAKYTRTSTTDYIFKDSTNGYLITLTLDSDTLRSIVIKDHQA